MSEDDASFRLDKHRVQRFFNRAADSYDAAAVLQREVGERLLSRLELIRVAPRRILDLGAGTGPLIPALLKRFPKAEVIALDVAPAMLERARRRGRWLRRPLAVCGDADELPLTTGSIDLVVSNLALHWSSDPERVFAGCLRVLAPDGLLLFSSFGPDTLQELRHSWAAADAYNHVNAFIDMHDLGDALVRARFADPVMDMERFTLTYAEVDDLTRDLRALGGRNATAGRPRGLTGRGRARAMRAAYEGFRDADGRLPATYEVVYGHAWAPQQRPQTVDASGAVRVPIGNIGRRMNP